jgi:hypothetical protein
MIKRMIKQGRHSASQGRLSTGFSGSLPSLHWRWWARAVMANSAVFLLALTFGPVMLTPYESVAKPLAIPVLAGALDVVTGVTFVIAVGGVAVGAWSLVVCFGGSSS